MPVLFQRKSSAIIILSEAKPFYKFKRDAQKVTDSSKSEHVNFIIIRGQRVI